MNKTGTYKHPKRHKMFNGRASGKEIPVYRKMLEQAIARDTAYAVYKNFFRGERGFPLDNHE